MTINCSSETMYEIDVIIVIKKKEEHTLHLRIKSTIVADIKWQ